MTNLSQENEQMKITLSRLLAELGEAYEKSDIKQVCLKDRHEWHYSLITTTLKSGGPLILGFNWGASGDVEYKPQLSVDRSEFPESHRDECEFLPLPNGT